MELFVSNNSELINVILPGIQIQNQHPSQFVYERRKQEGRHPEKTRPQ